MAELEFWNFQKNTDPKLTIVVHGENSAKDFLKLIGEAQFNAWLVSCDSQPVPVPIDKSSLVAQPQSAEETAPQQESKSGAERRKHKRISATLNLLLAYKHHVYYAVSVNVSMGGMKLKSKVPPEFLGHPCNVTILSPISNTALTFVANILEAKEGESRLQFGEISEESKVQLENFIEGKPIEVPVEDS
jgi:hypothetical protein